MLSLGRSKITDLAVTSSTKDMDKYSINIDLATIISVSQNHFKKEDFFVRQVFRKINDEIYSLFEKDAKFIYLDSYSYDSRHSELDGLNYIHNQECINTQVDKMFEIYNKNNEVYRKNLKSPYPRLYIFTKTFKNLKDIYTDNLYLKNKYFDFEEFYNSLYNLGICVIVGEEWLLSDYLISTTGNKLMCDLQSNIYYNYY